MRIGILGAGNVGGMLGKLFTTQGHDVQFGVRDPNSEKTQSALALTQYTAKAVTGLEAASCAEILFVTTPWEATQKAIATCGDLTDKILVDCTNPIALGLEGLSQGLIIGHHTSGAEEIAQWAPGAKVVKALNNIGANCYENPQFQGMKANAFICGNDTDSKQIVKELIENLGFDVIDVGSLDKARLLEPLGMLWINLAVFGGMGRDFAINVVKR